MVLFEKSTIGACNNPLMVDNIPQHSNKRKIPVEESQDVDETQTLAAQLFVAIAF